MAADKYNVTKLREICIRHFKNHLSLDNAMEVMVVAYIVPNGQNLFKVASDFASKHRKELVKTSKWDELKMKYPDIILKVVDAIMFKE